MDATARPRSVSHDPHAALRDDVRVLGELLGRVLQQHGGTDLFERVERVRALAKSATADNDDFDRLADYLRDMSIDSALPLARAFGHFLHLANIAEQHHRIRRRRDHARDPEGGPQRGSCDEAFRRLLSGGVSPGDFARAVKNTRVELVLTAHPTEIARRTVVQQHNRIARLLAFRDRPDLTPAEREDSFDALHREIATAWQTDEVRRARVSPLDEVRAGLVIFEESLWDAVPRFLRGLERALRDSTGEPLPLDATPVTFGSWIGGDRDGNPNVTAEITRQSTFLARWMAADLYLREIVALRSELSVAKVEGLPLAREPYRAILAEVRDRLIATRRWAEASLAEADPPGTAGRPYFYARELAQPLEVCFQKLEETGNGLIACGRLSDILRRISTFGLTLARLDLRQDARRHTEAIEWIAQTKDLGAYEGVPEPERQRVLVDELEKRRLTLDDLPVDAAPPDVREVLETFRMAAKLNPESLGAYVITMASVPSDVLAVELLQAIAAAPHPQRVVPLFETADDLHRAGAVLRDLLAIPWYRRRAAGRQEVMVGYSDSAKDAGRLAAAWALYRAQEDIIAACRQSGVELTLFHGRGGSIGRGGGPTYLAIQSQPPGSVRGALRVTEQGEMLQAKFGLVDIALRTLEVYLTATLEATLATNPAPKDEWRAMMDRLAARARDAYRGVVYNDPQFARYFRAATPEPELSIVNIGSRPARRAPVAESDDAVETLRAIPWQFAWTQTRLMLPAWLGLDEAFEPADRQMLREMYARWPFFQSTIDLIEMALAKADGRIAAQYDRLVPPDLRSFGRTLRRRLERAIDLVLGVTRHGALVENNPVLRRSIDVRNPYVDPINLVHIELLRRLRQPDRSPEVRDAFVVTVNGIAAGMRNTG
jgi:phosphoenolpyruvate carboxylase